MKAQTLDSAINSLNALVEEIKQDGIIITGSTRAWIVESASKLLVELRDSDLRKRETQPKE